MKHIKVPKTKNLALDWLVAKCEDMEIDGETVITNESYWDEDGLQWSVEWEPSTNWAQGGPLIEREGISICYDVELAETEGRQYWATMYAVDSGEGRTYGPTPLIAAMRCYVVSKLGETVEVPEELL